jgi:hypothetical protein
MTSTMITITTMVPNPINMVVPLGVPSRGTGVA